MRMEARLLANELLSEYGVFWAQMADEVEAFDLHLVTTTYGEVVSSAGRVRGKLEVWKNLKKIIIF